MPPAPFAVQRPPAGVLRALATVLVLSLLFAAVAATQAPAAASTDRVTSGLIALYEFDDGAGAAVRDSSGHSEPLDLHIANPDGVVWHDDSLQVTSPTVIASLMSPNRLNRTIRNTNAFTFEAWVEADTATTRSRADIVTLSRKTHFRNASLSQVGAAFEGRVRTSTNSSDAAHQRTTTSSGDATTGLQHIVLTRDASGQARLYVDGQVRGVRQTTGDLSKWNSLFHLGIANELDGSQPWLGTLHLVAIYDQALTASQVATNEAAGPRRPAIEPTEPESEPEPPTTPDAPEPPEASEGSFPELLKALHAWLSEIGDPAAPSRPLSHDEQGFLDVIVLWLQSQPAPPTTGPEPEPAPDPEPTPEPEPGVGDGSLVSLWSGSADATVSSWSQAVAAADDGARIIHLRGGTYGGHRWSHPDVFLRNVPGERVRVTGAFVAEVPDVTLAGVEVSGRFEGRDNGNNATLYRSLLTGSAATTFNGGGKALLGRLIEVHSLHRGPAYAGDWTYGGQIVVANHGGSVEIRDSWIEGRDAIKGTVQAINGGRNVTVIGTYLGRGASSTFHLVGDGSTKHHFEDSYFDWHPHPIGGGVGWEMRTGQVTIRNVTSFRPYWRMDWHDGLADQIIIQDSTFYDVPEIGRLGGIFFDGNQQVQSHFRDGNTYRAAKPPAPTWTQPNWWNELG